MLEGESGQDVGQEVAAVGSENARAVTGQRRQDLDHVAAGGSGGAQVVAEDAGEVEVVRHPISDAAGEGAVLLPAVPC